MLRFSVVITTARGAIEAGVIQYLLKPEAGIVANLEYAMGKDDNAGIYLKMGYSF